MGSISDNLLEDILSRTDIVELISGYIPLKKAGRNFKALCPFHQEKTPSFFVSPDRQIYHCFGCNCGGNAFHFLMRYERTEFLEAVRTLAKKAGVELSKATSDERTVSLNLQIYRINEITTNFYHSNLFKEDAKDIREYLFSRKINLETIKKFRIGYAKDDWGSLLNFLRQKEISLSLIERAGLIISKPEGGYYDRFRKRIIFPISDIKSRVIGFGARRLERKPTEDSPKYINSPETPVYVKGKTLYGLNFAKDRIIKEDRVAVVEGYMDFIMPFQEGFETIVSSMGIALTLEQIRLLKRFAHNVILVFDSDTAGELATLRGLDLLLEEDVDVKIFCLPTGFDPDSFVREFGIEKFKEGITEAKGLYEYKLDLLKSRYPEDSPEDKAKIISEMLPTISKFKNSVLKFGYLKKLSEQLYIDEEVLRIELKRIKQSPVYEYQYTPRPKLKITPAEQLLLKILLEEKRFLEKIKERLLPDDFSDLRLGKIITVMSDLFSKEKDISLNHLMNNFTDDEEISSLLCELGLSQELIGSDREKIIDDCIRNLKITKLKKRQREVAELIKITQNSGDEQKLKELVGEFNRLTKEQMRVTKK